MLESWALPAAGWLVTPALVTGVLLALARMYDPPTRWARRLKEDIAILGGISDEGERRAWQEPIDARAMQLREYRRAFVGWTLFWKWVMVLGVTASIIGLVVYPPTNQEGQAVYWGPGDYILMSLGLVTCTLYMAFISTGHDFLGRSPRELLLAKRASRFRRRSRKLRRLDKERVARANSNPAIRRNGSRLGFETQVDEFGAWMRDRDLREYVRTAGFVGADIHARYGDRLRRRGVDIPEWPSAKSP